MWTNEVREAGMDALSAAAVPVAGKRKKRSALERRRIVEETLAPGASV